MNDIIYRFPLTGNFPLECGIAAALLLYSAYRILRNQGGGWGFLAIALVWGVALFMSQGMTADTSQPDQADWEIEQAQ